MLDNTKLVALANTVMPFGKYKGRMLIALPEEYLLWFARKDNFPSGPLGELMELALVIKMEGLEHLIRPLQRH